MSVVSDAARQQPAQQVRLVYHYSDGHDFTTETMLRSQAVAYMPLLHAVPVDPEHYRATFATIELQDARRAPASRIPRRRRVRSSACRATDGGCQKSCR